MAWDDYECPFGEVVNNIGHFIIGGHIKPDTAIYFTSVMPYKNNISEVFCS